jgi:hypothetical protein
MTAGRAYGFGVCSNSRERGQDKQPLDSVPKYGL